MTADEFIKEAEEKTGIITAMKAFKALCDEYNYDVNEELEALIDYCDSWEVKDEPNQS